MRPGASTRITAELVRSGGKVKRNSMSASESLIVDKPKAALPEPFAGWFRTRGWQPHAHQLELLDHARAGRDTLLIAPTGGGKTLAGFLPSSGRTLPAARRNGSRPLPSTRSMSRRSRRLRWTSPVTSPRRWPRWPCRSSSKPAPATRPPSRRARQRVLPPDILLTTPEQIALMLSHKGAAELFGSLKLSSSMSCMRWRRASAAISWRSTWRGCARCRPS